MVDNLTRTQKILAFLVLVAFFVFILVAFKANQSPQNVAPRAQVAAVTCSSDTDCITYAQNNGMCSPGAVACAAKCDTATGQCVFAAVNTNTSATPTQACQEGVQSIVTKECTLTSSTNAASRGIEVTDVVCWNGEKIPFTAGCIDTTDTAAYGSMKTQVIALCAGKSSCSITPREVITVPPVSGQPTDTIPLTQPVTSPTSIVTGQCTLKSKGDVNCDDKIDLLDFSLWLSEFNGTTNTTNTDINGDGQVSGSDYEIWRSNFTSGS